MFVKVTPAFFTVLNIFFIVDFRIDLVMERRVMHCVGDGRAMDQLLGAWTRIVNKPYILSTGALRF